MSDIRFEDVALIYPFIKPTGLMYRKEKQKILARQKAMPYTSNEGVIAVQHFSASIKDGEFAVIVGPSGAGKSSVLRLLAGLEKPSVGNIYLDNEIINSVKPEDRDMAMVFQNYSIYPNKTVYQNIAFPLETAHLPREEIEEKVSEMIDILHLTGKEGRYAEELSGGERQRVAIGRALIRKPKVFLLDEPFANLDELMKNSLRNEIKRIQKELGITFVYVTHDQKDALLLADRIIVMKDGIIQQNDTAVNVYNYPANLFCGQFVGYPAMNIFEDIVYKNGKYQLFGKTYALTGKRLTNNSKIKVGVRPFNISVADEGFDGVINYTDIDGGDLLIHGSIQGKEIVAVEKNMNQEGMKYMPGQMVKFALDEDYFYFFDENDKGV